MTASPAERERAAADALASAVDGCEALDAIEDDVGVRALFRTLAAYRQARGAR